MNRRNVLRYALGMVAGATAVKAYEKGTLDEPSDAANITSEVGEVAGNFFKGGRNTSNQAPTREKPDSNTTTGVTVHSYGVERYGAAFDLSQKQLERGIHEATNDERGSPLRFDATLSHIARYHSYDMARRDYFAHTSPDGETMGDRYERFGYDCRVPTENSTYLTGSENIAYTYAYTDIIGPDGKTIFHDSEQDVATGIVAQWMHSEGHRENILNSAWRREGVGVWATRDDRGDVRIYATQNFC